MKKRPIEMRHRPQIAGNAAPHAAVDGVAHDRMADGAQVDPDLVRASRLNDHMNQRQRLTEPSGAVNSCDRFAAAPRARRHFLAIHGIRSEEHTSELQSPMYL